MEYLNVASWKVFALFGFSLLFMYFHVIRKCRLSFVSYIVILFSLSGVVEYVGGVSYYKLYYSVIFLLLLFSLFNSDNKYSFQLIVRYVFFTLIFILGFVVHGVHGIVGYLGQFFLYSTPVLFILTLIKHRNNVNWDSEIKVFLRIINVQIFATIIKFIIIGIQEKIAGTISISGGSIPAVFPSLYYVFLFTISGGRMTRKMWILIILSLIMPIASDKRAIWFILPLVIFFSYYFYGKIRINKNILYLPLAIPLVFYMGLRITPSLNPDNRIWGKFDPQYAWHYAVSYNLGKRSMDSYVSNDEVASGRLGGNIFYINKIISSPLSFETLFGIGNIKYTQTEARRGGAGFESKYMLTAWVDIFLRFGFLALISYLIMTIKIFLLIKNYKKEFKLLLFTFFLYFSFYSYAIIKTHFLISIYIFTIFILRIQKQQKVNFNISKI